MLLSMMSLSQGAASVLGVEENPTMCKIAREVLKLNNFTHHVKAGRIRLYEGSFQSLHLGHKKVIIFSSPSRLPLFLFCYESCNNPLTCLFLKHLILG